MIRMKRTSPKTETDTKTKTGMRAKIKKRETGNSGTNGWGVVEWLPGVDFTALSGICLCCGGHM